MSGRLITLEGLDGSGKATQTTLLKAELEQRGPLRHIAFPDYGNPSSTLVKLYLSGEFGTNPEDVNAYAASSFYAVDRFASFRRDWGADYHNGAVIVADRYTTSNMIYQLGKLPEPEWPVFLEWVRDYEYGKLGLPEPDLTVYLDMPPEVSQKLLSARYQGDESRKDIHEKDTAYLSLCRRAASFAGAKLGWRFINCACGDHPKSIEEIHGEIMATVNGYFNQLS